MEYIRTFTREFEVGRSALLDVENRSGTVTVRGDDTTRVRIEVVARLWAEDDAEAEEQVNLIERGIQQHGERISIRAPTLLRTAPFFFFGRGPRIDYQVTVPRESSGEIASRSGRVEVTEVVGPLTIDARSGRVAVSRIDADVAITSRSGSVEAEEIGGSLAIESRSGGVKVRRCEGNVTIRSRSGSTQVEEVGGSLDVGSRSGSLALADVGGALCVKSRSGSLRYRGAVRGPFDIEVMSGSILLAVDPDSNFFLDAQSASGAVRSDLPLRRAPAGGGAPGPGLRVRIRALSGSIRIVPR